MKVTPLIISALLALTGCQHLQTNKESAASSQINRETFAWPFIEAEKMRSYGGMTRGTPITLATEPHALWLELQAEHLDKLEKDRRAILAMAGEFRVSFQFVETAGFVNDYHPARPYFSWGTEHVQVLENEPHFISLQHTLVMYFQDESGVIQGPMVMKHWRQDWTYEDTDLHTYQGNSTWSRERLTADTVKGAWSQAVYQVDDSPRYEAIGRWQHDNQYSSWLSETSLRPLPRREFSVRNDYTILEGEHRITLSPNGWLHEQHNRKVSPADSDSEKKYLAQEIGINRYERITQPDLSAANGYWAKTSDYWQAVRDTWKTIYAQHDSFQLKATHAEKKLFEYHFAHAGEIEASSSYDPQQGKEWAQETIFNFLILDSPTPRND